MLTARGLHRPGPGLKVLGNQTWYGGGYCGVCGDRGANLIPQAVRYWNCDDGWRMGVLCFYCGADCAARGPRADDYAVVVHPERYPAIAMKLDTMAALGDLDSAYTRFVIGRRLERGEEDSDAHGAQG